MPGTPESAKESNMSTENIQEEQMTDTEREKDEQMKDGREGKLLIRWPGRQAWRKGFGLSSGPDPCL